MNTRILAVAVALTVLIPDSPAHAQSLTGSWQITVDELSNTCGDPLGPAESLEVDILQAGSLVAIDVPGGIPDQTPIEGTRSGSSVELGYETFDQDGVTSFDPAASALALNPAVTRLDGTMAWEFYGPETCTGTQSWTAARAGASTPGNLSGANWTITLNELTDSCDPIDPTEVEIPASIVQSGSLVEVIAPDFGQIRIRGRVIGQTLQLGLAIREAAGDFTVFDAADNPLAIQPTFTSFSGTMRWTAYEELVCTGVDRVTAFLPEPDFGSALVAGLAGLLSLAGTRSSPAAAAACPARSAAPRTRGRGCRR
jgi:hypothetical protein